MQLSETLQLILDASQEAAVDAIVNGSGNVFLTGDAGSGKSTIIKEAQKRVPMTMTAMTGSAALLIGGYTVDRLFCISRDPWELRDAGKCYENMVAAAPIIVIDEASQLGAQGAVLLARIAKDFKKRLILVGDLAQAAPVKDKLGLSTPLFLEATRIKLEKIYRQNDPALLDALALIRRGKTSHEVRQLFRTRITPKPPDDDRYLRLYATNSLTESYNRQRLDQVEALPVTLTAWHEDLRPQALKDTFPVFEKIVQERLTNSRLAHNLQIKVGARVLLNRNVYEKDEKGKSTGDTLFCNGDAGEVTGIWNHDCTPFVPAPVTYDPWAALAADAPAPKHPASITVLLDRTGEEVTVEPVIQEVKEPDRREPIAAVVGFPIQLGWAITINRSQGMTLSHAYVDMGSITHHPLSSRHGLAYVALSRVRTLEGLLLSGWYDDAVYCNPEVLPYL